MRADGLREAIDDLRLLERRLDEGVASRETASRFAARLRAATPPGYSGRLFDSVMEQAAEDLAVVGYSSGVETAGNPALDSVTTPRTRGQSVLRWVPVPELESILVEAFDGYAPDGVFTMSSKIAEQVNGRG